MDAELLEVRVRAQQHELARVALGFRVTPGPPSSSLSGPLLQFSWEWGSCDPGSLGPHSPPPTRVGTESLAGQRTELVYRRAQSLQDESGRVGGGWRQLPTGALKKELNGEIFLKTPSSPTLLSLEFLIRNS